MSLRTLTWRVTRRTAAALLAAATILTISPTTAHAAGRGPSHASFEGRTIDLREGWGEARACATDGFSTTCFRTVEAMDRHMADRTGAREDSSRATSGASLMSSCSSPVRLYDYTGYGTPTLSIYSRGIWLDLSSYGFDNRTASYTIGACSAYFADGTSGGGSWYSGSTSAYSANPDMGSSWRDRISSIYLT